MKRVKIKIIHALLGVHVLRNTLLLNIHSRVKLLISGLNIHTKLLRADVPSRHKKYL